MNLLSLSLISEPTEPAQHEKSLSLRGRRRRSPLRSGPSLPSGLLLRPATTRRDAALLQTDFYKHSSQRAEQGAGHATTTTTAAKTHRKEEAQTTFRKKKERRERIVGFYFGLWARCLSDELKKKICNDCHVASPGQKHLRGSVWRQTLTH